MSLRIDGDKLVDGDEIPIYFKSQDELKNPKNKLYCWIGKNEESDEWKAKIGQAIGETVLDRTLSCTGTGAERHVVGLWEFDGGDKPVHDELKLRAKFSKLFRHSNEGRQNGSLSEVYYYKSMVGLKHILGIIDAVTGCKNQTKTDSKPFADIERLVQQVIGDDYERVILDLCARWGKTRTALELMKMLSLKLDSRISVMLSYVRTAESSYVKEINENRQYDDMVVIDPDQFKTTKQVIKAIDDAMSNGKHVFYYFALTGKGDASDKFDKTCFNRRMKPLLQFKSEKMDLYVDEADFGAKTEKQTKKIQELVSKVNTIRLYLMTGTRASEVEAVWQSVKFHTYKKDYILDVLLPGERKNAVGIKWHVLDNSSLAAAVGNTNCMENFSDMCEIVDGHLKGESYFRQIIKYLYNPDEPVFDPIKFRELSQARIVNPNFATMIWLPKEKEIHHKFAEILEGLGYVVYVVNGDITCNADAEREVKALLEENAVNRGWEKDDWRRGKNVFILSGGMAKRSFSVAEIKNIIFLTNGGEYASVVQGASRGLTPFSNDIAEAHPECKMCNIVDFRLQWNWPNLSSWLAGLGTNMLDDNNHMSSNDPFKMVTEIAKSTQKISFMEYSWNGSNPIRQLTEEDMRIMMQGSRDFKKAYLNTFIDEMLESISEPFQCELSDEIDISMPVSGNVKGDSSKRRKKVKLNSQPGTPQQLSSQEDDEDSVESSESETSNWKLKHVNFVWNHADWFSTPNCTNVYDALKHMSADRKAEYQTKFKIDMKVIEEIVAFARNKGEDFEFSQTY